MPLYELKCSDCGNQFESLVFDSNEAIKCTCCDSENTEKLFSTFGLKNTATAEPTPQESSGCCTQSGCSCC